MSNCIIQASSFCHLGFANVCEWQVTTTAGDIVFDTTTSGDAFEQGLVLFDHTVPITDSMFVTLVISNPVSGLTCLITNTLYWEETEVFPGIFVGNWNVIGFNPGIATAVDEGRRQCGRLRPVPFPGCRSCVRIDAPRGTYALTIRSTTGALVHSEANFMTSQRSMFPSWSRASISWACRMDKVCLWACGSSSKVEQSRGNGGG
jgi:hypothetical protein